MSSPEKQRILVVEPDPGIGEEVVTHLESWDMEPVWVQTHFRALSQLEENDFSLVVVSIEDTGIDGLEFCRILRQRQRQYRLDYVYLILLGRSWHRVSICESRVDADDFIIHPFLDCELKWRVATGLQRFLEHVKNQRIAQLDPRTGVLNEKGLSRVLYQEVNRIGRKQGRLSVAVLDFKNRDWMEVSLGETLTRWAKDEVLISIKDLLRNYDQVGRTKQDKICIVSGDNSLDGIKDMLRRVLSSLDSGELQDGVVNNVDIALGGNFLSLQVETSYGGSRACAEHLFSWVTSQDAVSDVISGQSGTLNEDGVHPESDGVSIQDLTSWGE